MHFLEPVSRNERFNASIYEHTDKITLDLYKIKLYLNYKIQLVLLLSAPVAVSYNEIIQLVQSGCHLYFNLLLNPQAVTYTSEDTNLNITHSSWNPGEVNIVRILMQDYKAFISYCYYFLIAKF